MKEVDVEKRNFDDTALDYSTLDIVERALELAPFSRYSFLDVWTPHRIGRRKLESTSMNVKSVMSELIFPPISLHTHHVDLRSAFSTVGPHLILKCVGAFVIKRRKQLFAFAIQI